MEMDRFDSKFRNTHGREPGQQQRWRQTYCVLAEPHPRAFSTFQTMAGERKAWAMLN